MNLAWKTSSHHFAGSGPIGLSWELPLLLYYSLPLGLLFFISTVLYLIFTHLFLPSLFMSLSYHSCCSHAQVFGKLLCTSSTFPFAILNGTCILMAVQLHVYKRHLRRDSLLSWWLSNFLLLLLYIIIIIVIFKKGWQCKTEREWNTPYQSEDPIPTIPTYRQKKVKGKNSRRL